MCGGFFSFWSKRLVLHLYKNILYIFCILYCTHTPLFFMNMHLNLRMDSLLSSYSSKVSGVYWFPFVFLFPPPLPGRRCASPWAGLCGWNGGAHPLPPLSVTQRIPARPDAAGVTGALISVLGRTKTERRSAALPQSVRSFTPRRTMLRTRLSTGDRA